MGTTESVLLDGPSSMNGLDARHLPERAARASAQSASRRSVSNRRATTTTTTLRGIVVGLPESGKRTLLTRLEGKDPFHVHPRNGDQDQVRTQVTVPYKPAAKIAWDDRIQLHVEIPTDSNTTLEDPPDFCVLLIHPHHDPRQVMSYIVKIMLYLMHHPETQLDIPVCWFLNFRDLQQEKGGESKPIRISDLQQLADEVCGSDGKKCTNPLIASCSLRNCYGLARLHHFIFQSYLLKKQTSLRLQLGAVERQLQKSQGANGSDMEYEEFLRMINPQQRQQAVRSPSNSNQRRRITQQVPRKAEDERSDGRTEKTVPIREPNPRRTVSPKQADAGVKPKKPRQSLEDFLAEDSDDEDVMQAKTPVQTREADDDDDDGFFYDGLAVSRRTTKSPPPLKARPLAASRLSPVREQLEEEDPEETSQQVPSRARPRLAEEVAQEQEQKGEHDDEGSESQPPSKVDQSAEIQVHQTNPSLPSTPVDSVDESGDGWSDDEFDEVGKTEANDITANTTPVDSSAKKSPEPVLPNHNLQATSTEGTEEGWSDEEEDLNLDLDDGAEEREVRPSDEVIDRLSDDEVTEGVNVMPQVDDDEDDDDFVGGAMSTTSHRNDVATARPGNLPLTTNSGTSHPPEVARAIEPDNWTDGEDEIVRDLEPNEEVHDGTDDPPNHQRPPKAGTAISLQGNGMNDAVLAAIAAAEKEAQMQLREQLEEQQTTKKSKKTKKEKKSKKTAKKSRKQAETT